MLVERMPDVTKRSVFKGKFELRRNALHGALSGSVSRETPKG